MPVVQGYFPIPSKLDFYDLASSSCSSLSHITMKQFYTVGREPWSSSYGWRLMYVRLWVRILVPYTGWTFGHFFTLICCKIVLHVWKNRKWTKKRPGLSPITVKQFYVPTCGKVMYAFSFQTFEVESFHPFDDILSANFMQIKREVQTTI